MRAVARMVREPPPSMLRAAPKKRLGLWRALASTAGGGLHRVEGAGQTGDRVEEDDHVVAAFHQAFGFFEDHAGHFHVVVGGLVEGGGDDFGLDAALHVGDLFRALVDEQDDHIDFRVVVGDGVGDVFEEHRLTGFRLGHDQAALAFSDRGEEVDHTDGDVAVVAVAGEIEFLVGEERGQEIERYAVADEFRGTAVDAVDFHQREIFVAFARRTDLAQDGVARLEGVHLDLALGDVDVVRRVEVVIVGGAEETVAVGHDFQNARGFHDALEFDARLFRLLRLLLRLRLFGLLLLLRLLGLLRFLLLGLLGGLLRLGLFRGRLGLRSGLFGLRLLGGLLRVFYAGTFALFLGRFLGRLLSGLFGGLGGFGFFGRSFSGLRCGFGLCRSAFCGGCVLFGTAAFLFLGRFFGRRGGIGRRSLRLSRGRGFRRIGILVGFLLLVLAGPFLGIFVAHDGLLVEDGVDQVFLGERFGFMDLQFFCDSHKIVLTLVAQFNYV